MRGFHLAVALLSMCAVGCVPLSFRTETPYLGSGSGRIVSMNDEPGPIPEADRPKPIIVPIRGLFVPIPGDAAEVFQARTYAYEVRANDGTLHLVGSTTKFALGDCIAWKGYSDGPSMTQ